MELSRVENIVYWFCGLGATVLLVGMFSGFLEFNGLNVFLMLLNGYFGVTYLNRKLKEEIKS